MSTTTETQPVTRYVAITLIDGKPTINESAWRTRQDAETFITLAQQRFISVFGHSGDYLCFTQEVVYTEPDGDDVVLGDLIEVPWP